MPNPSVHPYRIFWSVVGSVGGVYLLVKLGIPYFSMLVTGTERPLPVPGALTALFLMLTLIGALVYVSTTEEKWEAFLFPLKELLHGRASREWDRFRLTRLVVLGGLPILAGWYFYDGAVPKVATPTAIRIQHPTIPGEFENLTNPFRVENPDSFRMALEEGVILYQTNCRPCHGTAADGNGPMARAFRLRPANFRDPGTIATVVEAFAFWRVSEGGPGLPPEATPWDSAMPRWKDDLNPDEMWKIILAEYQTAGVEPRKPEKLE